MKFQPSLSKKPMTSLEVSVVWDALKFHPTHNRNEKGGVYIAYTLGMKGGPGGYFGVQIKSPIRKFNNKLLSFINFYIARSVNSIINRYISI